MRSETSIDISILLALLATSLLPVSIMLNYNTLEDSFLGLPITVLLLMGLVYNMPIKIPHLWQIVSIIYQTQPYQNEAEAK